MLCTARGNRHLWTGTSRRRVGLHQWTRAVFVTRQSARYGAQRRWAGRCYAVGQGLIATCSSLSIPFNASRLRSTISSSLPLRIGCSITTMTLPQGHALSGQTTIRSRNSLSVREAFDGLPFGSSNWKPSARTRTPGFRHSSYERASKHALSDFGAERFSPESMTRSPAFGALIAARQQQVSNRFLSTGAVPSQRVMFEQPTPDLPHPTMCLLPKRRRPAPPRTGAGAANLRMGCGG